MTGADDAARRRVSLQWTVAIVAAAAWKVGVVLLIGGLAITAIGGYVFGWTWTGYADKRMWEWLNLLLFPLVLFLLPGWARQVRGLSARAGGYASIAGVLFVIVIIGGYSWGWEWTGFVGNTFRDWLGLLIAPFVVPAVFAWIYTRQRMQEPLSGVPAAASSTPPQSRS